MPDNIRQKGWRRAHVLAKSIPSHWMAAGAAAVAAHNERKIQCRATGGDGLASISSICEGKSLGPESNDEK